MEFVIGIDSGGTNYRVRAEALDGTQLGLYIGGCASHYAYPETTVKERINESIDECLRQFGGKREDCRYLVVGTTGLDSDEDGLLLNSLYHSLEGFHCTMTVINDVELAFYTVIGEAGALVISGTGSIAFGMNRQKEKKRVGGWALSLMGEEGSGRWVTRRALHYLADCYDGVAPETALCGMLKQRLNIQTRKNLTDYAASLAMDTHVKADLADLVDAAAEQKDDNAVGILKEAALQTFGLIDKVIRALNMSGDPQIKVGVWGSNIVKSSTHLREFEKLLKNCYPQAILCQPQTQAVNGAGKLARELLAQEA
ncbi:MAG: BadF/BadG/BcrA/BcrD ATPase family protein [Eubacteriales bacterium]|nr:BadF/BadG/BcrA/BcrD ATPase family protein [Eubacteriales bacterium]